MADRNYFCVENIADFSENIRFVANKSFTYPVLEYSLDDGETWVTYSIGSNIQLAPNTKCYFRGNNSTFNSNTAYIYFTSDHNTADGLKNLNISGNIMSLVDKTCRRSIIPCDGCFYHLFHSNHNFNNTLDLVLPATTLKGYCYQGMFYGCTSLTIAPDLPATTLMYYCYGSMFEGCTSLKQAPELPATTLATRCYNSMFSGCTSLITAPNLSATTLALECYRSMFSGCTSLTTVPELPATTLSNWGYRDMFNGCTSLEHIPALPAKILANSCYTRMFNNCSSIKLSEVPTEECSYKYRLPILGNIQQTVDNAASDMFTGTGGVTTIELNKDYYINVKVIPNYINYQIHNLAFTTTAEIISHDLTDVTIVLSSIDCFKLPETINVTGADYSYNSTTGEIVLTNLTDNITVRADGVEILLTPQVYLNYNTLNISPVYRADNYEINFEEVK